MYRLQLHTYKWFIDFQFLKSYITDPHQRVGCLGGAMKILRISRNKSKYTYLANITKEKSKKSLRRLVGDYYTLIKFITDESNELFQYHERRRVISTVM